MPVNLGDSPQSGFDEPIALLMDCHRRIERFLGMLLRVREACDGRPLPQKYREAAEAALRYFAEAAPRHTEDEEQSLFPAMRASGDERVSAALAQIDHLEREHEAAGEAHAEVDGLMRRWLDEDALDTPSLERLHDRLTQLHTTYQRHIGEEDEVLFPLAAEVLSDDALETIGREMARRRGLEASLPPNPHGSKR